MASQDCISLAFRGEWKPFPTVHQSGRPKSAGALLGKTKSAVSLGLETNFEATISGKQEVHSKKPFETLIPTESRLSFPGPRHLVSSHYVHASSTHVADSSPVARSSLYNKETTSSRQLSRQTSTFTSAIDDDAKAQKYKMQNMSALIYKSVQQGCMFVPRVSATKKTVSHKQSSFASEAKNTFSNAPSSHANESVAFASARPSSAKKKSTGNSSISKVFETTSELVTSICSIRADLRTAEQISVLMKQIQSNAFLSKLPEETLKELCRVMKVQSYYRKDRVFIQGDVGEHFFIILEGKCVVYKELTMQQAREMQLDLSGNDPSVSITTVANKDWNLGVMTALRAKGASAKILEKVKSREKNAIVKKIVEIKQKLERLGDSEDPGVRKYTETLRLELAEMMEHLENILVKIGKFSGDVLQTQIEETIQEALKIKTASEIFDAHGLPTSELQNAEQIESVETKPEEVKPDIAKTPSSPAAERVISSTTPPAPTYTQTEFLSSDTKLVIKRLVELSVGAAFGEIALENANSKRTATIVAETDCKLITITRADYRNVLADLFAKKKATDVAFLRQVPIFSKLNPRTLETLQSVMTHQTHGMDKVILEAESETSDFFIIVSGIVRVVMRFAFEESTSKTTLEMDSSTPSTHSQKVRTPSEMTVCKLGTQNTFGEFYVGRKSKCPVSFIADSPQVVVLRLALLDCQHYLANDFSISSQLMNFARRKSEFYVAQCKAMLKTKGSSYQLAAAMQTVSSTLIPYPSEAELMALLGDRPKPPRVKSDMAAWTRLFPTKKQNPNLPSYWRHDAWREMFEQKQLEAATVLNKIDEFAGVTVVGTHVRFPVHETTFNESSTPVVKQLPATATLRVAETKRGEDNSARPTEYSVKNRTLNLQSWDMPVEHHVNISNRVDSSGFFGKKHFYYSFDPDKPDADYLEDLDLQKID